MCFTSCEGVTYFKIVHIYPFQRLFFRHWINVFFFLSFLCLPFRIRPPERKTKNQEAQIYKYYLFFYNCVMCYKNININPLKENIFWRFLVYRFYWNDCKRHSFPWTKWEKKKNTDLYIVHVFFLTLYLFFIKKMVYLLFHKQNTECTSTNS